VTGELGGEPLDPLLGQPRMVADPRISVYQAAQVLLRCSKGDIRQLIADGRLAVVPGTQRRVYETDVRELARRRPPRKRTNPPARRPPDGHIDTAAAALILGTSIRSTQRLAATERIPAYRDSIGRYCYRPEQLELVRRAWQAARDNRR
jgi:excisionase family DNA binding protein